MCHLYWKLLLTTWDRRLHHCLLGASFRWLEIKMSDWTSSQAFHRPPAVPRRGIMDYPGKSYSAPHCDKRYFLPDMFSLWRRWKWRSGVRRTAIFGLFVCSWAQGEEEKGQDLMQKRRKETCFGLFFSTMFYIDTHTSYLVSFLYFFFQFCSFCFSSI